MEETKVIYHVDDQETPYLIKLPLASDQVTLLDLKNALNKPNFKYFFKSMDDDFGVVKEEIIDDRAKLPSFNGRIITWLVASESSVSDTQSQCAESVSGDTSQDKIRRATDSSNQSMKPPSNKPLEKATHNNLSREFGPDTKRGLVTDSHERIFHQNISISSSRPAAPPPRVTNGYPHRQVHNLRQSHGFDAASSVMSSDIETTSFVDSEDDAATRYSTTTDATSRSSRYHGQKRRKRRHKLPVLSQASSFSSITESTMSLNIITITLNMESASFLGISIVGQSSKGGDGGIYVGSIMKGGAIAQDGRIEPGDMILEVNGVSFENMSNDDAVRTLREAVQHPGPITLVVAKCWDPNPKGYFTIPRQQEPVRPIDPSAWVMHSEAMRGMWGRTGPPSVSTMTSASSSLISSVPGNDYVRRPAHSSATSSSSHSSKSYADLNLTKNADMATIVRAMAQPDSGLDVRDRMWLKIPIPHSFIGSELVDWLYTHVDGFADRRDARRYACNLLKFGYIQHTVNKLSFSEQCYYVFGTNICTDMASVSLDDIDSVSSVGRDRDVVGPLPPPPQWNIPYSNRSYGPPYLPQPMMNTAPGPIPASYNYINDGASYVSMPGYNGAESIISGSVKRDRTCACIVTHTYKQIRKLWDNPDKTNATQNAIKLLGKFDPDIDRSTSSDTGSSDSESSQSKGSKEKSKEAALKANEPNTAATGEIEKRMADRSLPPPPRDLSAANAEMNSSRQSFRLAMGNAYTDDTIQVMGDL